MFIPIVIGALVKVTKGLKYGLEDLKITGQVETIQTTALLRSVSILRRVLETRRDLQSLRLRWKTISKRWGEKISNDQKTTTNNNNDNNKHHHYHHVVPPARISLALALVLLYRPSLLVGLQDYILYRYRAAVNRF